MKLITATAACILALVVLFNGHANAAPSQGVLTLR